MHEAWQLWLVVLLVGAGTLLVRQSFLGPWARGELPAWAQRALKLAPPVIFAALITPMIFLMGEPSTNPLLIKRLLAVSACFAWAYWRGGQFMPVCVGMLTLHLLKAFW
jgi:branched-subunit amino acid transport protein